MPIDYNDYPDNWHEISEYIRFERADCQCECEGECGLHQGKRCIEVHDEPAVYARGKIILTVAHLDHDTSNNEYDNLKAMCQRCHLRYDSDYHRLNAAKTRRRKQRNAGQLVLWGAS